MSSPEISPEIMASWPTPNYENPRNTLYAAILGLDVTLMALTTLFLFMRFYSRAVIIRNALGADDWTMFAAWALLMATLVIHIVERKVGIGRHMYDVPVDWFTGVAKFGITTQILFGPTAALTKVSVCLTYLRIFPSRTNTIFCYTCIGIVSAYGITAAVGPFFQCVPFSDIWELAKDPALKSCYNFEAFNMAISAINTVTDFLVFLWPVHYLWNVQLSLRKRLGLIISFSLGVIVCVVAVVRLAYMTVYFDSWDVTYYGAVVYLISDIETALGVICGCLPCVRPIMRIILPGIMGTTDPRSNTQTAGRHTDLGYGNSISTHQSHRAGYRDIHITRDVEMKASPAPTKSRTLDNISDDESQEWIFRPDAQPEVRTDIRGPTSHGS